MNPYAVAFLTLCSVCGLAIVIVTLWRKERGRWNGESE
jgi:hypothetical protein